MLSLCEPYGHTITCLCDHSDTVLRCFLTGEEGDRENSMQEEDMMARTNQWQGVQEKSSNQCPRLGGFKTEIIIAGAIILIIIGLMCA